MKISTLYSHIWKQVPMPLQTRVAIAGVATLALAVLATPLVTGAYLSFRRARVKNLHSPLKIPLNERKVWLKERFIRPIALTGLVFFSVEIYRQGAKTLHSISWSDPVSLSVEIYRYGVKALQSISWSDLVSLSVKIYGCGVKALHSISRSDPVSLSVEIYRCGVKALQSISWSERIVIISCVATGVFAVCEAPLVVGAIARAYLPGLKELFGSYWTATIETMPPDQACKIPFSKLSDHQLSLLVSRQEVVNRLTTKQVDELMEKSTIAKDVLISMLSPQQFMAQFGTVQLPDDKRSLFDCLSWPKACEILSNEDHASTILPILTFKNLIHRIGNKDLFSKPYINISLNAKIKEILDEDPKKIIAQISQEGWVDLFAILDSTNSYRLIQVLKRDQVLMGSLLKKESFIWVLSPSQLFELCNDPALPQKAGVKAIRLASREQLNDPDLLFKLCFFMSIDIFMLFEEMSRVFSGYNWKFPPKEILKQKISEYAGKLSCFPNHVVKKSIRKHGLDPYVFFLLSNDQVQSLNFATIPFATLRNTGNDSIQRLEITPDEWANQLFQVTQGAPAGFKPSLSDFYGMQGFTALRENLKNEPLFNNRAELLSIDQVAHLMKRTNWQLLTNLFFMKLFATQFGTPGFKEALLRAHDYADIDVVDNNGDDEKAYKTLGLPPNTPWDQVRKTYIQLCKTEHPDVNTSPGSDEKFKAIVAAYEHLKKKNNK